MDSREIRRQFLDYFKKHGHEVVESSSLIPKDDPTLLFTGAGMNRDSTLFLTEKGVKVVGIDAWSWDRPLPFQAKEFSEHGDPKVIWEAHFAGIDIGYCHMEKLANLSAIGKPHGFQVCCFPVKIKGHKETPFKPLGMGTPSMSITVG